MEEEKSNLLDKDNSAFELWWHNEGSGMPPYPTEDREIHMLRVARIAWLNGADTGRHHVKLKAYYAHCTSIYDTTQERRDIATLEASGLTVVNPNCDECRIGYATLGMDYFRRFANECDLIVFRALPHGGIPAGVAMEIEMFRAKFKPVLELPSPLIHRTMTIEQTREYLCSVGVR